MMPFYNIFNEWYAATTSKKIRAVWQSKAEHGKRISPTVPYGYVNDATDKEKWLIDEPAAQVVKKNIRALSCGARTVTDCKTVGEREKSFTHILLYICGKTAHK